MERIKLVVNNIRHAPAFILFSRAARIDADGYRWAPLLFRQDSKMYSAGASFTTVAEVRKEGLLVRLGGIMLEGKGPSSDLLIKASSEHLPARMEGEIPYSGQLSGKGLSLILRVPENLSTVGSEAVMVEVFKEEEDVIFTRFLTHYFLGPAMKGEGTGGEEQMSVVPGTLGRETKKIPGCVKPIESFPAQVLTSAVVAAEPVASRTAFTAGFDTSLS